MRHSYYGSSVWRYESAFDRDCLYKTEAEARAADLETAVCIVAEATAFELECGLKFANPQLQRALKFLAGEMDEALEALPAAPQP